MRLSKTIFCDDEKIEITADTSTMIRNNKRPKNVDEFLATYGNDPDVAKMARLINTTVTEVPLDFWREFCAVLVKSASAGFLGIEYSECLPTICNLHSRKRDDENLVMNP